MGNYTPNPFMTQPAHLPPLGTITFLQVSLKETLDIVDGWPVTFLHPQSMHFHYFAIIEE